MTNLVEFLGNIWVWQNTVKNIPVKLNVNPPASLKSREPLCLLVLREWRVRWVPGGLEVPGDREVLYLHEGQGAPKAYKRKQPQSHVMTF